MALPLHVGLEHPNLTWIVVAGVAAFAAGLGVNLYRSLGDDTQTDPADDTDLSE